ncbi:MAG: hypothetical protein IPQ08_06445 [Chitinophagaceae bacterium]|nr:hypothetical protein [Chitinophagaceae bacterium]
MSVNLQKKISIAKVFGKVNAAVISKHGENGKLNLVRFMGSAQGVKEGVSDFGEWRALTGQFRAIALSGENSGAISDSAVCFLPDVALDLVCAQLTGGASAVDFAFDISAVMDESVAVGYSYRATPLIEAEEESPISRLEKKLAALPAPVADDSKAKVKK